MTSHFMATMSVLHAATDGPVHMLIEAMVKSAGLVLTLTFLLMYSLNGSTVERTTNPIHKISVRNARSWATTARTMISRLTAGREVVVTGSRRVQWEQKDSIAQHAKLVDVLLVLNMSAGLFLLLLFLPPVYSFTLLVYLKTSNILALT